MKKSVQNVTGFLTLFILLCAIICVMSCSKDNEENNLTPQNEKNESSTDENDEDSNSNSNNAIAIDLGLSVKWANMNVGASKPEDYGNYFAWGETTPKTRYVWDTYKWCNGTNDTMTKYCYDSDWGTVDHKIILETSDDAAGVCWGGSWRMPKEFELNELIVRCTWEWTTQNGVNGYTVTGSNGNSIFLPAAGWRYDKKLEFLGSYGFYMSSSLDTNVPQHSRIINFYDDNVYITYNGRNYGLSVRPVTDYNQSN